MWEKQGGERDLLSAISFPKRLRQPVLNQAEARNQKLYLSLVWVVGRGARIWTVMRYFSRYIIREIGQEPCSQDSNQLYGSWHYKSELNWLCCTTSPRDTYIHWIAHAFLKCKWSNMNQDIWSDLSGWSLWNHLFLLSFSLSPSEPLAYGWASSLSPVQLILLIWKAEL